MKKLIIILPLIIIFILILIMPGRYYPGKDTYEFLGYGRLQMYRGYDVVNNKDVIQLVDSDGSGAGAYMDDIYSYYKRGFHVYLYGETRLDKRYQIIYFVDPHGKETRLGMIDTEKVEDVPFEWYSSLGEGKVLRSAGESEGNRYMVVNSWTGEYHKYKSIEEAPKKYRPLLAKLKTAPPKDIHDIEVD